MVGIRAYKEVEIIGYKEERIKAENVSFLDMIRNGKSLIPLNAR